MEGIVIAIEHNTITDPDIHEPKGIATAGDGEVYVADGLGTGAWRPLSEFSGAMVITDNSNVQAVTAASDSTLATFSDYIKVINFTAGELDKITFSNNELTLPSNGGGLYLVNFYANVKASANNTDVAVKFAVNGASGVARRPRMRLSTSGVYYNLSATGLVSFSGNDVVSLYVASTNTCDITFQDSAFLIHRVGE